MNITAISFIMIHIHRTNKGCIIAYTLYYHDAYKYETVYVTMNHEKIILTHMYFDKTTMSYKTTLSNYKKFIEFHYECNDSVLFDKFIGFDIMDLNTLHNGENIIQHVQLPIYKKDFEMFNTVKSILSQYEDSFYVASATVIQTYYRKWKAMRLFSVTRLRLLNDILYMPPKSVVSSFPGGYEYNKAFDRFWILQK